MTIAVYWDIKQQQNDNINPLQIEIKFVQLIRTKTKTIVPTLDHPEHRQTLGPGVIKLFHAQMSLKFELLINTKVANINGIFILLSIC